MNGQVRLGRWTTAVAFAVGLPLGLQAVAGWTPEVQQPSQDTQIPSLTEPGETLQIRQRSTDTGLVTFAASEGRGILVSVQANAPTETRARSFIAQYGASFGVADQSQLALARRPSMDTLGVEHVRFRQQHNNIPVVAGELLVHLKGARVMAANGRTLPASRMPDTTARIADAYAIVAARALVDKKRPAEARGARYLAPRLQILNRGMLADGTFPSHLAWFVEAVGPRLREYIWVDAHVGGVVLHFSQLAHARNRAIYDANNGDALPGTLKRAEGDQATGDVEEDALYDMFGAAYDYFSIQHGRDSFNAEGATIVGSVDLNDGCPNAFWDGTQTAFCDGLVADDVVHHEFTHAVTEYTAGLFYFNQSGALNESFSDIFGETIDLTDGIGNDTPGVRWGIGEDSSMGIIRDMMNPQAVSEPQPGKMTDPEFGCLALLDGGGVHTNSGVPNHAYALMVDGGTYNGRSITGIGLTKAGRIQYRALSVYLSSGSTFMDAYSAVNQSCADLVGTNGITAADCTQVNSALRAVEMNLAPLCPQYTAAPALCADGAAPASTLFSDNFETIPNPNWAMTSTTPAQWAYVVGWGDGTHAHGPAADFTSIHDLGMTSSVMLPANARMYFDHAFFHEGDLLHSDGSVIEYSTDAGGAWSSAQALIEAGQMYNGTLHATSPLGAVMAFTNDSFGYTGTRLNLSSLQGQSVRFRLRVASDESVGYTGWVVDNFQIYTCGGDPTGNMVSNGDFLNGGTPPGTPPANWFVFSTGTAVEWNTTGGSFNYRRPAGNTQGVILQQTGIPVPAFTSVMATFTMGNTDPQRKRFSVLIHDSDFSDLAVCTFWLDPGAPPQVYAMTTHTTKPWTNATISIYAASLGVGGFYQFDNVLMFAGSVVPTSTEATQCIDPGAPFIGGVTSGDLVTNGTFTGGTIAPWFTFGQIQSQLAAAGVFEFFKLAGAPAGLIAQQTGQTMAQDQRMRATFQLGNSSALRQRVTVILHDASFADLHACTFILPPGLPLSTYSMRTYATQAWTNAQIAFYPATVGTAPSHQWLQLDNVSLARTTTPTFGSECYEPGDVPAGPGLAGKK